MLQARKIDNLPEPSVKPKIKVIVLGCSKTGTLSYAYALEKLLDGPVHHTASQLFNREDSYCKKWNQIYRYKQSSGTFLPTGC
ncbi:hypothetical protein T069G_00037 [Trichoderma breve]|uniref:Sulfotransferase domain-containing protein n=1 Tax=Trichoderma breve TaxID=2034170 RepID=A0A9W9JRG0_9HYPO|nr:hypothetical protein T069G_00037 [Trichoderma breve]KAJ4863507.1 hypothetical protein T069G_00037 [Trichoderma breve]